MPLSLDEVHPHLRDERVAVEPKHERVDHLAQPAPQRVEDGCRLRAGLRLGPGRRPHSAHQAPVFLLEVPEAREGAEDREPLRVSCVDARKQRLAKAFDRLLAEAAAQEGGDRLVAVAAAAGDHDVESHPQLAGPGEELAVEERADLRRHREHHSLGQRVQAAAAKDVDRAVLGVRGNEAVAEAELTAERKGLGFLREDRVRPALEQEAVAGLRADHTAQEGTGLDQPIRNPALLQGMRGGESGDAAADDGDLRLRHECPSYGVKATAAN